MKSTIFQNFCNSPVSGKLRPHRTPEDCSFIYWHWGIDAGRRYNHFATYREMKDPEPTLLTQRRLRGDTGRHRDYCRKAPRRLQADSIQVQLGKWSGPNGPHSERHLPVEIRRRRQISRDVNANRSSVELLFESFC